MAPQTHTRYRVQRLIRLGEWLERNEAALTLAADVISEAHDTLVDPPEDMPTSDIVEQVGFQQLQAVMALNKLVQELRFNVPTRDVTRGKDVTLHHPFAYGSNEYEVVIKAPVPNVPSQAEVDAMSPKERAIHDHDSSYNIHEQERLHEEYVAAQIAKED